MRELSEIVIHCLATPEGRHVTVEDVDRWHRNRGWRGIGYHFLVYLDGTVAEGRPVERSGAHVAGRNAHTIGVAYVGGVDRAGNPKDTRTAAQRNALESLLRRLLKEHLTIRLITGHNVYAAKACPSFDATAEYRPLVEEARGKVTGLAAVLPGTPDLILKRGSFGQDVREWQAKLVANGSFIAVDGDFGQDTERVTRWFQRAHGLVVDGKVGPQTREAMDEVLAAKAPANVCATCGQQLAEVA